MDNQYMRKREPRRIPRKRARPATQWSDGPRFHAKQLSDRIAPHHFKAGVAQHPLDLSAAEKVHRTSENELKPHFTNRHAPGPETGPRRKKGLARHLPDDSQSLRRVLDVIPEADRDTGVVSIRGVPVENVGEHEIALVRRTVRAHQLLAQTDHFGRDVNTRDMLRSALDEFRDKPAGAASDIADLLTADIS